MAEVDLDARRLLLRYLAVPPLVEQGGPWPDPDWSPLFQAAELDAAGFGAVSPEWAAPVDSDRKAAWAGVLWAIIWLFLLVLLRILLRRNLLALMAWCFVSAAGQGVAQGWLVFLLLAVPWTILELLALTRFGLLGYASYFFVAFVLTELPLSFDASQWWASRGFAALLVVVAVGIFGFRTALAGKPAFGGDWLET
jgi:hypothetical protein